MRHHISCTCLGVILLFSPSGISWSTWSNRYFRWTWSKCKEALARRWTQSPFSPLLSIQGEDGIDGKNGDPGPAGAVVNYYSSQMFPCQ